jgi:DNA-binding transcriptional LysR family regulator
MAGRARYLDAGAELDLRKLRYFLAVAHHLNFGRAARELLVAQPALSRAIQILETDLGARLFERDHHKVSLTPAGTALVREAEALLGRSAAARRRVRAASGSACLKIGFRPGIIITHVVRRFTTQYPGTAVNAVRIEWDEQHAAVLEGRVDIAWIRTPIADEDLAVTPLFDDPEMIALPRGHRLADQATTVTLADLADEPLLRYDTAPEHDGGRPAGVNGIRTMEEKLEAVALGHGLALVPATAAAYYQRPDITYRPVAGAAPYQVALATRTDTATRPEVQAFIKIAAAVTAPSANA